MPMISPHFAREHFGEELTDDEKIAVFVDGVRGWQLDIAKQVVQLIPDSGLAVLAITASYFEMIGKAQAGCTEPGNSKVYWIDGMRAVFDSHDAPADKVVEIFRFFYDQVRCEMYHTGGLGQGVVLFDKLDDEDRIGLEIRHQQTPPYSVEIAIAPRAFVRVLQIHFSGYARAMVNRESPERANFLKWFDAVRSRPAPTLPPANDT